MVCQMVFCTKHTNASWRSIDNYRYVYIYVYIVMESECKQAKRSIMFTKQIIKQCSI